MCNWCLLKAYLCSVRTSHVLWAFIKGLHAISTYISCVMNVYRRLIYYQYEHLMCNYGLLLKAYMQSVRTSHVLWTFIEGLHAISTNISCVMGVYGRLTCDQYEHLMCYGRLLKAYMRSVRTSHVLWAFIEGLHAISRYISCVMGFY